MMLPAAAQWPADDNNLLPVAPMTPDTLEHYYPLMIRKADGTTLVAYETLGFQTNPDTGQKGAKQTYYLYFQKLDKNGNTVWPAPGKLISHQHTLSASYGRLGMDTLSNGNVVLIRAEQRAGDTTIVGKTDQRIYVYCLDQEGNPVWSDATKMPVIPQQKDAFQRRMLQHRVTVSGDNIYATVMVDEGIYKQITPDSVAARYIIYFEAACLDFDGNVISQRIDSVSEYHIHSGEILMADERLREWFTEQQLLIMRDAVEDHRASGKNPPRTIYGAIVAESDRQIDPETVIRRTMAFSAKMYPDGDFETLYQRTKAHLLEKYAEGGYTSSGCAAN